MIEKSLRQCLKYTCIFWKKKKKNQNLNTFLDVWSVRVPERLALPTSDHGVAGSNPAGGEILSEPKWRFVAQSLPCSPFHPDLWSITLKCNSLHCNYFQSVCIILKSQTLSFRECNELHNNYDTKVMHYITITFKVFCFLFIKMLWHSMACILLHYI